MTQRPNMRRLNLIQIDELDFAERKSTVLGQGAFGTVFAVSKNPFYSPYSVTFRANGDRRASR